MVLSVSSMEPDLIRLDLEADTASKRVLQCGLVPARGVELLELSCAPPRLKKTNLSSGRLYFSRKPRAR
jgi:hypothetical protein